MKPLIATPEPFTISYGGWLTTAIIDSRSGTTSSTSEIMSSVTLARVWLKTTLPYNSYIYLRGKDIYTYYIKDDDLDLDNENDIDLDAGFFYMSLLKNSINYSVGRKFYLLGSGLVFNGRGDGGEFNFYSKYADLMVFGAYTGLLSKETNPYRLTSQYFTNEESKDEGKRIFAGGLISKTFLNHTLYLLGLYQTDKNDEPDNANTSYNSQYYGLGFKGVFKNAFYYGEYIIERGESFTNSSGSNEKQSIKASAAILSMNYYFDIKLSPAILLQYAYGSGDSDKDNPSSLTGNTRSDDKGFIYFGNYSGGYGLRPYLSNIHIYRAGAAISPFSDFSNIIFKRINISAIYSNYQKDVSNKGINEGEATEPNKDLGHGFDLGLAWQIYSDLSFFGNFGLFIPGSAYASGEKNRTFIMAGINLSF
ncbi:MAG: alginate export family protein [Spirochaetota bacterium]